MEQGTHIFPVFLFSLSLRIKDRFQVYLIWFGYSFSGALHFKNNFVGTVKLIHRSNVIQISY